MFEANTNIYKISKTIKMELIPQGKTQHHLEAHDVIAHNNNILSGRDAKLLENYTRIKVILTAMHRLFINTALEQFSKYSNSLLTQALTCFDYNQHTLDDKVALNELKPTSFKTVFANELVALFNAQFDLWAFEYKEDMQAYYQQKIDSLRNTLSVDESKKKSNPTVKEIAKLEKLKDKAHILPKGFAALYDSNTVPLDICFWLVQTGKLSFTENDFNISTKLSLVTNDDVFDVISAFKKFSTYLQNFHDIRANLYAMDLKSGSVSARLFDDNLTIFFENKNKLCRFFDYIQELEDDAKSYVNQALEQLNNLCGTDCKVLAQNEAYVGYLSQAGIDRYNQFISGSEQVDGLNQIFNQLALQYDVPRKLLPKLSKLQKQLLTVSDNFIERFESDNELFVALTSFKADVSNITQRFTVDLHSAIAQAKYNLRDIYIIKNELHELSNLITGRYKAISKHLHASLPEKTLARIHKQPSYSLSDIANWLEVKTDIKTAFSGVDEGEAHLMRNIEKGFLRLLDDVYTASSELEKLLLKGSFDKEWENKDKQKLIVQTYLQNVNALIKALKIFKDHKKLPENKFTVFSDFAKDYIDSIAINSIYSKTQTYLSKKPYSTDKVKLTFGKPTFMAGWSRNNESSSLSLMFMKDGQYYLGVLNPDHSNIFDYVVLDKDSDNKIKSKNELAKIVLATDEDDFYEKMRYEQISGVAKALPTLCWDESINSAVMRKKNREVLWGEEITRINKTQSHKTNEKDKELYVEYFIKCALSYYEKFNLSLKNASEYESFNALVEDIARQAYSVTFDKVKASYVEKMVNEGKLYLFRIYNKDFSTNKKSKGTDNLHTLYFKELFSKKNLENLTYKLNGGSEVFFRPASINYSDEKRKKGHHHEKLKDRFNYPILKDRRFSVDKFFFHFPITINPNAQDKPYYFNRNVNNVLRHQSPNVLAIHRGEKNLVYVVVTDFAGNILYQDSLDVINGVNYNDKLSERTEQRNNERRSWSRLTDIKNLKTGYISFVINQICMLMLKYKAVIAIENLNSKFVQGRAHIEKAIYQQFTAALINKLNYLVIKNKEHNDMAGLFNGLQLTNTFETYEKIGKQSGFLFLVDPAYTGNIDPITGFTSLHTFKYTNVKESQELWKQFDKVTYNAANDAFEISLDFASFSKNKIIKELKKTKWTLSTHVDRYVFNEKDKKISKVDVTDLFKIQFKQENIDYTDPNIDLKNAMENIESKAFHLTLVNALNILMQVKNSNNKVSYSEHSVFIHSPVAPYFDSRKTTENEVKSSDSNSAYHIALKCRLMLEKIKCSSENDKVDLFVNHVDWLNSRF